MPDPTPGHAHEGYFIFCEPSYVVTEKKRKESIYPNNNYVSIIKLDTCTFSLSVLSKVQM